MPDNVTNHEATDNKAWGQQLKKLREDRYYSCELMAEKLHLDVSLIHAIENDDYEKLPSRTYVIGYIRNYVKILGIENEVDMEKLEKLSFEEPELIPKNIYYKKESKINSSTVGRILFILMIMGLVAAIAWGLVNVEKLIKYFSAYETKNKVNTVISMDITTVNDNNVWDNKPNTATKGVVAETKVSLDDVIEKITSINPTTSPSNNALTKFDTIIMRFTDDSWTQVTDGQGKQLVYKLMRRGKILELKGRLPFEIVLGNSAVVKIELNGKAFDQSKFNKNEIAHFMIQK